MDVREKLVNLILNADNDKNLGSYDLYELTHERTGCAKYFADYLVAHGVTVQECARPIEEWGEDYGDVLWWKFPIEEPPYVGSPLDEKWPAYHTHWTLIILPQPPKGE